MGLHGLPKVYSDMRLTKKVARLPSKGLGISGTKFVAIMRQKKWEKLNRIDGSVPDKTGDQIHCNDRQKV